MSAQELTADLARDRMAARTERGLLERRLRYLAGKVERARMAGHRRGGRKSYAEMVILQDRVNDIEAFLAGEFDADELRGRLVSKALRKFDTPEAA